MKLFALYGDLTLATQNFNSGVEAARAQMKDLQGEMDGVQGAATKTGSVLEGALGHALGDILSGVTQAAIETAFTFATEGVELASNMEETNAKIDTIFGASAENIHRWAKTTKESYGIGELSAKTYAAQVAGIISTESKNLTSEEIENISTSLVGLAGDLASFHNMSFPETWKKLLSGLRGETEAIEDLGVDLRVSNLADAFGMSPKDWGELDQRTRLLNTYQYIMQETALAQGDFARTSDSYANQLRQLEENIQELKTSFGESLLPVMTQLVTWFNSLFGGTKNTTNAMDGMVDSFSSTYATIETTTANALALVNALSEMEAAGVDTANEQGVWNTLLSELSATLPGIDALLNTTTGAINGGTEALKNYVLQWQETQREIAVTQAVQGLQNEVTKAQTDLLEAQWALEAAERTPTQTEALQLGYINRFREYLVTTGQVSQMESDYMDNAAVDIMLSDMAEAGDVFAGVISGLIDSLTSDEDKLTELQSQEAAAKLEYELAVAKLNETLTSLEYMQKEDQTQGTGREKTGTTGKELPAQNITITLNASIDGTALKATLVPEVTSSVLNNIDWRFQTKAVQ